MEDSTENEAFNQEDMSDSSSLSSSCTKEEPKNACLNPSVIEYTDQIREKLIKTAQMDRLSDLADIRLAECGWKTEIQNMLRAEIRKRKDMTLEQLYELVRERGISLVPNQVKEEMVKKIQKCYEADLPDVDDSSNDRI